MAGYSCPDCKRKSKLPDFCCGNSMLASGSFVCPNCKAKSKDEGLCACGTQMSQI